MLDFSSEKEMKIAKGRPVYEGYMRERLLAKDDDQDKRNARENAKARRMSNGRVSLKEVIRAPRAPRGRRPRTISKETVEISREDVEIQQEVPAKSPVRIIEKDQVEDIKEEGENKKMESEGDADIGEKTVMPMGGNVEECYWPEMPPSYEEEWMMSGWEKWVRYDQVMSGLSWFSGVDYTDEEGLVWEDDLWNLRNTGTTPPNP